MSQIKSSAVILLLFHLLTLVSTSPILPLSPNSIQSLTTNTTGTDSKPLRGGLCSSQNSCPKSHLCLEGQDSAKYCYGIRVRPAPGTDSCATNSDCPKKYTCSPLSELQGRKACLRGGQPMPARCNCGMGENLCFLVPSKWDCFQFVDYEWSEYNSGYHWDP